MIDIKLFRKDPKFFEKASLQKGIIIDIKHILEIDKKRNELQQIVQKLQEERNMLIKDVKGKPTDIQIKKGKEVKEKLEKGEHALTAVEEELQEWLQKIPNPSKKDVKVGKDDS